MWPSLLVKATIEMLVNGTRPSAVSKNLESAFRLMFPHAKMLELPNVYCMRKPQGAIRNITECLAAYQLAKDPDWKQLWWDGTSRRTISLTTFSARIKKSNTIKSIVLSCSHVSIGATLEDTVQDTSDIVEDVRDYLDKWRSSISKLHPTCLHDTPDSEALSLKNCDSSAHTIDTCNQACESRKLLIEHVEDLVSNGSVVTATEGKFDFKDNDVFKMYLMKLKNLKVVMKVS